MVSQATAVPVRAERKKRTKYVLPEDQVAHLWAHQAQERATNPRRTFYFEGPSIYSYGRHFLVAEITDKKLRGRTVVLFNSQYYSNTTRGHQFCVSRALKPDQYELAVPDPSATSIIGRRENYKQLVKEYANLLDTASRARNRRESYLAQSEVLRKQINDYRLLYLAKDKQCPTIAKPRNFEKAVAEAASIRNEFDRRHAAEQAAKRRKEEKVRQAQLERWLTVDLAAWKRGETYREQPEAAIWGRWISPPRDAPVDFRLLEDGETVETTRGARFPKSHCARAFKAILRCRKHKAEWRRNGAEVRVGHFQLDSIDAEGNVQAGCHEIKWEQIYAFAIEIGLIRPDSLGHDLTAEMGRV